MSFSSAFSHSRMTLLRSASNSIGPCALQSTADDNDKTQNNSTTQDFTNTHNECQECVQMFTMIDGRWCQWIAKTRLQGDQKKVTRIFIMCTKYRNEY